jgi:hypothetical protein
MRPHWREPGSQSPLAARPFGKAGERRGHLGGVPKSDDGTVEGQGLFRSFLMGGFECSAHRRHDGIRLDVLAASGHDRFARSDYAGLTPFGIKTVRDGVRWHLIEASPGRYDWSSFLPMLRAAHEEGTQVIWDLCHYGWPDHLDIWSDAFVESFARFASAAARLIREETGEAPFLCPVNEISFWAWAGGDVGHMNPGTYGRANDLKRQLARTAIAATEAVRGVDPAARFLSAEPAIHLDGGLGSPEHREAAEKYRVAQYEACDMISGRMAPELGGRPEYLDIVGINFYPSNQWYHDGSTIPFGHHAFRPLSSMLAETHERYGRPVVVAETGAEGSARAAWLHYVLGEVQTAIGNGVPVGGVCLYPIVDCPGWVDDRVCPVGLFSTADSEGRRSVYEPLAREIQAFARPTPSGDRRPALALRARRG